MRKERFLVIHECGMSDMRWWIHARSAREIAEKLAEVEVIDDPDVRERAVAEDLEEVDIDAPTLPAPLHGLRDHRIRRGFVVPPDRSVVYLRWRWDGEDGVPPADYLMEVGSDGRRIRQVEAADDGTAVRSGPDDWLFNPPVVDLFEPGLSDGEIGAEEFEAAWLRADHLEPGQ